jgi:hypothetical protein
MEGEAGNLNTVTAGLDPRTNPNVTCGNFAVEHVRLFSGEERLLEFTADGGFVFAREPKSGRGSGSR